MRRGFGLIGLVLTTILLVIVGVIAYNVGWSDGVNTHLPAVANGTAQAPYYYGFHPYGFGFGLFGIFWFFLIIFGIFWLLRLVFWGAFGRRMWHGGWGYGQGMGPGRGWGSFEERAKAWHSQQHGEGQQPPSAGSGTPPPPSPPPDSRSV